MESNGDVTSRAKTLQGREGSDADALLDRYKVLEFLGEGSMGRVYRARDTELGRDVALKWVRPGRIDPAQAQARLRREAQAMAMVEHAAVVRIYDVGISLDRLFVGHGPATR
jgi:serine/threonine-protein kinase